MYGIIQTGEEVNTLRYSASKLPNSPNFLRWLNIQKNATFGKCKTTKNEHIFLKLHMGAFSATPKTGLCGAPLSLRPRRMATCGGPAPWLNPSNPLRTNRRTPKGG
jgi:hypothetical protein